VLVCCTKQKQETVKQDQTVSYCFFGDCFCYAVESSGPTLFFLMFGRAPGNIGLEIRGGVIVRDEPIPGALGEVNPPCLGEVNPPCLGEVNPPCLGEVNPPCLGSPPLGCGGNRPGIPILEPELPLGLSLFVGENLRLGCFVGEVRGEITELPPSRRTSNLAFANVGRFGICGIRAFDFEATKDGGEKFESCCFPTLGNTFVRAKLSRVPTAGRFLWWSMVGNRTGGAVPGWLLVLWRRRGGRFGFGEFC